MEKTMNTNKANPQKWVALYSDMLFSYALPRINNVIIAEDLVQETFLSGLKGIESFKGEASEKNWLFAILKNKIVDYHRSRASEIITLESDLPEGPDERFKENGMWLENSRPQEWREPENPMERKEMQKVIDRCKQHLKELQQKVFTLKYLEELDSDNICKVLRISPSNYWVLIHRARLQMRECIEKNWLKK